jgi:hypothetical protein
VPLPHGPRDHRLAGGQVAVSPPGGPALGRRCFPCSFSGAVRVAFPTLSYRWWPNSFALTAGQAGTGAGSSMCGPVYPSGTCGGDGLTSASFASVGASTLGALAAEAGLGAEACSAVVLPQPLTISKAATMMAGAPGPRFASMRTFRCGELSFTVRDLSAVRFHRRVKGRPALGVVQTWWRASPPRFGAACGLRHQRASGGCVVRHPPVLT